MLGLQLTQFVQDGAAVSFLRTTGSNSRRCRGDCEKCATRAPYREGHALPVSNARVFGRQAASQAGASSGHVARVRQQVPSGLAAHMRLFSLCRPPHRRVFLDKGQTSAERKKLQHTSQHAIAARVHACARAYVRAYVRSHPNDEETALPTDNPRAKLDRRRFLKVTPKNVAAASSELRTVRFAKARAGRRTSPSNEGGNCKDH